MHEGLLTTEQVAARLGVRRLTVAIWCRRGLLSGAERVGTETRFVWLIPEGALEGFVPPKSGRPRGAAK